MMVNKDLLVKGQHINAITKLALALSGFILIGQASWLLANRTDSAERGSISGVSEIVWIVSLLVLAVIIGFLVYLLRNQPKPNLQSNGPKELVNNLSHEFKTPLTSIQLAADVLKNPNIVNQPQRLLNYATIISTESNHLCSKVERMLQMAELEEEKVQLNKDEVDLNKIVEESMLPYVEAAKVKGGDIMVETSPESANYRGDALHLKNAIGNIIDNSIKYNTGSPEVRIAVKTVGKKIEINIEDNGIGIDKAHQKLLFDKFYRVPTGDIHDVKGLGLGLNYVSLILKAHGGEVSCTSELGKGSIFTLTFPYQS